MKKRKIIIKRTFSIILASAVLFSGIPVYGQEMFVPGSEEMGSLFGDGTFEELSEEPEFVEEAQPDFSEEAEVSLFSDEPETELFAENGVRYIKGRPLTKEEKAKQLAPFEELVTLGDAPSVGSDLSRSTYALYPARYDARESGLITEAKNQNPFGICWAFGMASLLETSLLSQGRGAYDLSEEHLAYFMANRENDPLGNTAYDVNQHLNDYHEGGNDYLASVFLTTWSGMTTEKNVPLPTDETHTANYTAPLSPKKAYDASVYLTDAVFSDYSVDRMKQMLMEDHSVSIMFRMLTSYYNPDTGAYCFPRKDKVNHVVTIVGWDDNYSKDNFLKECGVTTDGAWIAKNSWGPEWGEDGFFYVSYEDKNISSLVSAKATDQPQYRNNYFYDGSSGLNTVKLLTNQSVANIFEAKAGKGAPEVLGEVNTVTFTDNMQYTIQIYTDIKNPSDPTSGTPAYEKPYPVAHPLAGVKTIKVPEVLLKSGTNYSVVIKNTGETGKFCCEADSYYDPWFQSYADVDAGQGFFCTTKGKWSDLGAQSATPRIKAHTRTLDALTAPKLKAASKEYNQIALSWNKSTGADGYLLYRGEAGGKKKEIADLSPKSISYLDKGLKTGVKYTYAILPYQLDGKKVVKGQTSSSVSAAPQLQKPKFKVRASAKGYNILSWSGISGATAYRIYRKTPTGSFKLLKTVNAKTLKYYDKSVSAGTSFAYTVRAYRKTSAGSFLSKYTTGDVIKTAPAKQKVSSVASEASGIRIKWQKQKKCDGYRIYRKTKDGSWGTIKTISSGNTTSYLDKTARKGVSYYYAVRAYVKEPYGTVYGNYTASSLIKRK